MNREALIQQTFDAGGEYRGQYDLHQFTSEELERFASAIRAATKEEDARICEKERVEESTIGEIADAQFNLALEFAAGAIRASK